jgi:hypothetical protein
MRIQETDRILKEARVGRQPVTEPESKNVLARTWQKVTQVFKRQ